MNCQKFEELITAHLDGELTGAESAEFREHQLACTPCRTLLDDVAAAIGACAEMPEIEPPLELLSRTLVIPALNPPVDCKRFADLITEFLDGYLEPRVYHAFEDHAHSCDGCADTLAGVALAVSACHSVHFSEHEIPEGLVERIMAETVGVEALRAAQPAGWVGRLRRAFKLYAGPTWAPRMATAAFIVALFSALVTDGALAPSSIYEHAAKVTSRVYNRSADIAARSEHVLYEVERLRSDADQVIETEKD